MNLKRNIFITIFIVISILYILFRVLENQQLMFVFKPLVVITGSLYYIFSTTKVNYVFIIILILQLIGDTIFIKEDMDSFMFGINFFFAINILLSLMITNKIGLLHPKDIFKIFLPVLILFLILVYVVFASTGLIKVLISTFALTVAILFSAALKYYLNSKQDSAKWILTGISSLILCYIFAALIRLVKPNIIFSFLEASCYCFYVFCLTKFAIIEDTYYLNKKSTKE